MRIITRTSVLAAASLLHIACGASSSGEGGPLSESERNSDSGGDGDDGYGASYEDSDLSLGPSGDGDGDGDGDELEPPDGTFEAVGTNPFVIAGHDPLSTFAADVDTASYEIFRSYVTSGELPNPASVRLEEFVNYFDYGYEKPAWESEHPFLIHLDAAPHLVSRSTHILRVGIQGKEPPPDDTKKPANLVFLIDTSGSMQEEMDLIQKTLRETVELLDPSDTLSIVVYASSTGVLLPATPIGETTKITNAINSLTSGGSTNGAGGITAAYSQAESAFLEGGINHVLLCTDGDFNVGPSSTEELEELIVEKRETGITLTALGFGGGNYNDALMERVSNAGNGIYGYIGSEADAEKYVAERMLSSLVHIAQDVKLQVEFNPEFVYAYRLLGYENRNIADDDFRDDVVDAGEIGAGHTVTALYELVFTSDDLPMGEGLPTPEDGAPFDGTQEVSVDDLVLVKVRYKEPGAAATDPALEVSSSLTPTEVMDGLAGASSGLQWAVAVASFAEILKESPYADEESLAAIRLILESQAEMDADRTEFLQLFDQAGELRD